MHFLLVLSLFASSITLGRSLSCETCHAFRNTCTGSWEHCLPEKDSCGIVQMEGSGLMQVKAIVKSCIRSRDCAEPDHSINLGRAGQMFSRTTCCMGNNCQKILPALPPINTTPNGKRCPACYVVHSHECVEETAECAGNENYCFGIVGTMELGGTSADIVMKGCTSSASCNKTLDGESLGTIKMVSKSSCVPALQGAGSVPTSFGFLLQAFTGLILLKVLG
ncbi:PREDICTED: phospholipase A2 inhibitor and Ly6/PLAUR domain-containing protein-like [Gekko japonicus]|uniref:Phospholipase A2 inhibitor and Ly6/PLAUR domain-containing protein-like n=1 Tax=Gekko japonicus TaxID=146911 RepID=A0ABM1LFK7_GEKJA|nr:PREDICTED: phospholipase A2 inhibitor and Ly6/PLAUR domain-containing protein-like [Gekko japonicus]